VVLIKGTASASEILAGALQEQVVPIGKPPLAKAIPFDLPDGSGLALLVQKRNHQIFINSASRDRMVSLEPITHDEVGTQVDQQSAVEVLTTDSVQVLNQG